MTTVKQKSEIKSAWRECRKSPALTAKWKRRRHSGC